MVHPVRITVVISFIKYKASVFVNVSHLYFSLILTGIYYGRKKFYDTGPRSCLIDLLLFLFIYFLLFFYNFVRDFEGLQSSWPTVINTLQL